MRRPVAAVGAVVAGLVLLAGCGEGGTSSDTSTPSPSTSIVAPIAASERGQLVSSDLLAQVDPAVRALGAQQYRVVYRSTSGIDGGGVDVSGSVFVPSGIPPVGGWPVVTVGHGTTGVTDECAPSLYPNLLGSVSLVTPFLARGAVVVVSDYQGLGTDGPHPYLDPSSAAYDLVDGVRAARAVSADAGSRWAAVGVSQGGQASWAAAELANAYGDGLDFVGSANLSPAADVSGLFSADGSFDLTAPQKTLIPFVFEGFRARYPDANEADYLHGAVAENKATLMACTGPMAAEKFLAAVSIGDQDTVPSTEPAREAIEGWLQDIALPRDPAAAPMMTLVGGRDTLVLPEWTERATRAACALGDTVDFRLRPDQGHADGAAVDEAVEWITGRFEGVPPTNTCGSLG